MEVRAAEILAWSIAWEGCLSIIMSNTCRDGTESFRPTIDVANTNLDIIVKLRDLTGGLGNITVGNRKDARHKPTYHWRLTSNKDCFTIAFVILEYLPIKVEQAVLMIEYCLPRLGTKWTKTRPRDKEIYEEMKMLNEKGVHECLP